MKENHTSKDGVELFLDNRQIFLLFFASVVILGLVFALGVVVGKKMLTSPSPPPPVDPLALLDQTGNVDSFSSNLTFHDELTVDKKQKRKASKAVSTPAKQLDSKKQKTKSEHALPPAVAASRGQSVKKTSAKRIQGHTSLMTSPDSTPKKEPTAEQKTRSEKQKAKPASDMKSGHGTEPLASNPSDKTTGSLFTLQLSSFQDRAEAERFIQNLRVSGMKPFIITANIPGRGIWYRVRLGEFKSWEEAAQAKEKIEKEQKIIAYVAKK